MDLLTEIIKFIFYYIFLIVSMFALGVLIPRMFFLDDDGYLYKGDKNKGVLIMLLGLGISILINLWIQDYIFPNGIKIFD